MGFASDILLGLFNIVNFLLSAYMWVVIISALISWVNPDPYNPIVRILRSLTDPVFYWIRARLPFVVVSGFDLSPIVVLVAIQFVQFVLGRFVLRLVMGA